MSQADRSPIFKSMFAPIFRSFSTTSLFPEKSDLALFNQLHLKFTLKLEILMIIFLHDYTFDDVLVFDKLLSHANYKGRLSHTKFNVSPSKV